MKILVNYIENLLVLHDCVVVPGLGGFIVQHESAKIQDDHILPPHAVIGFNRQLVHSDGLLTFEFARQNNMNYREADKVIREKVNAFLLTLSSGNPVLLGQLGWMKKNDDDLLEFIPAHNRFLPDNFGLAPLYISVLQPERKQIILTIPTRARIFKYAVACMLATLLLVSPKFKETETADYATLNPINWTTVLAKKEAVTKLTDTANVVLPECAETQEVIQKECHKYHIIVAALDKTASVAYCKNLTEKGFPCAHIIDRKKDFSYIAILSFPSKKEAIAEMQRLRNTHPEHSRAWVLCE